MGKFLLVFGLAVSVQGYAADGDGIVNFAKGHSKIDREHKCSESSSTSKKEPCCERGPRGREGPRGPQGFQGPRGPAGATGPTFEINNVIEAIRGDEYTVTEASPYIPFISPIINPDSGVTVTIPGAMTLSESVFGSGNFDTINLPIESSDTFYLVTYFVSRLGGDQSIFSLELNGLPLPYTRLSLPDTTFDEEGLFSQSGNTSVIVNPANTAGTLRVMGLVNYPVFVTGLFLNIPNSEEGIQGPAAYITVVKLNNNAP